MPTTLHLSQVFIELDGANLDPKYMHELITVEVDDSLYLPDMFSIHIYDYGLEALKSDLFKLGKGVKIFIKTAGSDEKVLLMDGEITSVEPDLNSTDRSTLMARGYDRSHKMHRVRKTATFLNMSDSDLASKLAQGAGLQASVKSSGTVYPYIMQANQTDWEFLMERAKRIGYRLYVEGTTLHFKPPESPGPIVMKWGSDIDQFRPRVTTMDQVTQVTVRGYDPKAKREIVGVATSSSGSPAIRKDNGSAGGATAQKAHSIQGKQEIVGTPVYSQAEAEKIAKAELDRRASGHVEAEGKIGGNPKVAAGAILDIQEVGTRFGGKYLVTRALHRYRAKSYDTTFWVSGGNGTMTITDLLHAGNGNGASGGGGGGGGSAKSAALSGVLVGIVTNNKDPDNMGRVKVKFPTLGDNIESHWCHLAAPMSGGTRGIAFFPEANDQVVVAFQNGDPNHGYVIGCVWNGADALPLPTSELVTGSLTQRRVIRTRRGHRIIMVDQPASPEQIIIMDWKEKNFIKIISDDDKIIIQCDKDVEVTSMTGNITVNAKSKDVNIKADAAKVNVQAAQDLTLQGLKVKITGSAGVDINSSAVINIKGAMINLN